MSKQGKYAVRISGLGEGDHDYSFELGKKFFDSFAESEVKDGNVQAQVVLEKKHGVMVLHFTLQGDVEVICDRCLEPFRLNIGASQNIFIKTGDNHEEIEDDVVMIGRDEHEIEVGQYLYEFIILALPFQRIHPADDGHSLCNPDMLEKLEAHRTKEKDQKDVTDPRWDVLKRIIEKNK